MNSVFLLAGEASGDILGAALMQSLSARCEIQFSGIGGPLMQAQGLRSMVDMERLSVMGLFEPLKRLPDLLRIKREVVQHCRQRPPAVFVGIDSPDFNLRVASDLHGIGISTCHYVSPSVWAWRQGRVKGIRESIDLMLTLFPFESAFYEQHEVPTRFVGHPLADQLPLQNDTASMRQQLQLDPQGRYFAVLPGSRLAEAQRMIAQFLPVMRQLAAEHAALQFLLPAANPPLRTLLQPLLEDSGLGPRVHILDGQSRNAMGAADAVLLTSGTSSLEAMLLKKPMVVAYRLSQASYQIVRHMVKSRYIALPNLLANKALVEEFVQNEVTQGNLLAACERALEGLTAEQSLEFLALHKQLRAGGSDAAADALLQLMQTP